MTDEAIFESFDGFLPPPADDGKMPENEVTFDADQEISEGAESEVAEEIEKPLSTRLADEDALILNQLAEWLVDLRSAAEDHQEEHDESVSNADEPGLLRLVEEFTALRHDVKLQAKSARGLQDQTETLLAGLKRAIEQFQSVTPREEQAVREVMKPLLESLTDLDASLDRGRLAAVAAQSRWAGGSADGWRDVMDATLKELPLWKRWCFKLISRDLAGVFHTRFAASWSATQDAQVEGYRLIQNRLRRLLQQHEIERIETVGLPTDPNRMTVIDAVDHDSLPAGTVLEELRPGYLWGGQLLRYAEVRVVRSRGTI